MFAPHVVSDRNLITARWYLDAQAFGERFADELWARARQSEPRRAGLLK